MELPAALRAAIAPMLEGVPLTDIQTASRTLSQRYRAETRDGRLHLDGELAVKAYLAARLPATFAAVRSAFGMIGEALPDFAPPSMLDVGAGPGTAIWAAREEWPSLGEAVAVEASAAARAVGVELARAMPDVQSNWVEADAISGLVDQRSADLVTLAYVLDELDEADRPTLVERLWQLTDGVLAIVEPGTPAGWQRVLSARTQLISAGAHIVAPCPHDAPCPLSMPDWCHFAQRVARSRLHRQTKQADVPFEDEKFIFISASRQPADSGRSRILAPPRQGKAWIDLKLCLPGGSCSDARLLKREAATYRIARRLDWGDTINQH